MNSYYVQFCQNNFVMKTRLNSYRVHGVRGSPLGFQRHMGDDCTDDSENVTYSPAVEAYVTTYDDTSPSVAIMDAVAEITDNEVTELESLQEATALDADALDNLFQPTIAGAQRESGRVEFTYFRYAVRVFSFGRIEIEPLDEDTSNG